MSKNIFYFALMLSIPTCSNVLSMESGAFKFEVHHQIRGRCCAGKIYKSPLEEAINHHNVCEVSRLINIGADPDRPDFWTKKTPRQNAEQTLNDMNNELATLEPRIRANPQSTSEKERQRFLDLVKFTIPGAKKIVEIINSTNQARPVATTTPTATSEPMREAVSRRNDMPSPEQQDLINKLFDKPSFTSLAESLYGCLFHNGLVLSEEQLAGDREENPAAVADLKSMCARLSSFDLTQQWPDEPGLKDCVRRFIGYANENKELNEQLTYQTFIQNDDLEEKLHLTLQNRPLALLVYDARFPNWLDQAIELARQQSGKTINDIVLSCENGELSLLEVVCLVSSKTSLDAVSTFIRHGFIATDTRCERVFVGILRLINHYKQAANAKRRVCPSEIIHIKKSLGIASELLHSLLLVAKENQIIENRCQFAAFLKKPVDNIGESFHDAFNNLSVERPYIADLIDELAKPFGSQQQTTTTTATTVHTLVG